MPLKRGIAVSGGYSIGKALVLDTDDTRIPKRSVPASQVDHEQQLALKAFEAAVRELGQERHQTSARMGAQVVGDILAGHEAMLKDANFRKQVHDLIAEKRYGAAFAISVVMLRYRRKFEAAPFLQERVRDLVDIQRRLLRQLAGESRDEVGKLEEPVIVVAHDLTPSQTAMLERTHKVLGFATDLGGATSHTAIVARGLGIPAVVGLDNLTSLVTPGDMLIVDGTHGVVIIDPDDGQIADYREQEAKRGVLIKSLEELRDLPAQTRDGVSVELFGNIEFPDEVTNCLAKGATGIGLFRTEFLYLGEGPEPTEEEQFQVYRQVAERLDGKPVIIRTLDLGGDKHPQSRGWEPEPNPFLGLRSIRYCLRHREVFWPQLRAILRASMHGDIRIMFPMITSIMELRQARYLLTMAMEELEEEGFEIRASSPIGIMVETPSAAICARELAREVGFMSIGTNDLVQYTLAVDRSNERVASLYTPLDPAVLRLLRYVIRAGNRQKVPVSLCGEMAGESICTMLLLGMGLRRFSMSAGKIPEVKKIIRSVSISDVQKMARRVFSFETEREVVNYLRDETRRVLPESV